MFITNQYCRICQSTRLTRFLSLGAQPPSNRFIDKKELTTLEPTYPLDAYWCHDCNLAQLIDIVDKQELFQEDYVYFSSVMPKVSPHWQRYANDVMAKFLHNTNDLVVEIGSNDGIVLKCFQERGYPVLGVDPARNIAVVAEKNGVPTLADFFTEEVAHQIVQKHGRAQAILANNVFAHINDHHSVVRGLQTLLSPGGVFVLEAPYLMDMFERLAYDSIYHEHLSFLALRPLMRLFDQFGLEVFDVQLYPVQGSSLRVFVGHRGKHLIESSVAALVQKELDWGFDRLTSYQLLAQRVRYTRDKLVALLHDLKAAHLRIAGFGAPARGNTLLNFCKIGPDVLDYILDDVSVQKQDKYSPGMHIPVMGKGYEETHPVDYYLLLSWNYLDAVLEKQKAFRERGGKFIVPIGDEVRIV